MRLRLISTIDYEIHGNGQGSPRRLMVEPTDRMLEQFDRHGARLTIMADVAEILRFRRHRDETGNDEFGYEAICAQLQRAVRGGHDVQLHLHPSYYRSRYAAGALEQAYEDYDLARLPAERVGSMVREGKGWLEGLLRPVRADYRCVAFRAANWSMNPSAAIARALVENGISIDTSVFKYGRREGLVSFDYSGAESATGPWPADLEDVSRRSDGSPLFEFPIYSEKRPIWHFLTAHRVYRAVQGRLHPLPASATGEPGASPAAAPVRLLRAARRIAALAVDRHAWKLDLNQCSGAQLIRAVERIHDQHGAAGHDLPIVLIGHSKLFTPYNERSLEPFLKFVAGNRERFAFGAFGDFDPTRYASEAA